MKQGTRANYTGREAVDIICGMLDRKGYRYKREQLIGKSIYGHPLKVDIFTRDMPGFPEGLIVESKWQASSGSVDEKFPYLVENIRHCYPCQTVIVLSGGGYRNGAARWLRAQTGGNLRAVMDLEEFIKWINSLVN